MVPIPEVHNPTIARSREVFQQPLGPEMARPVHGSSDRSRFLINVRWRFEVCSVRPAMPILSPLLTSIVAADGCCFGGFGLASR